MEFCVDISEPDYKKRKEILCKKNQQEQYGVSEEILDYIAKLFRTNPRLMIGALKNVAAYSRLNKKDITLEDLEQENIVL